MASDHAIFIRACKAKDYTEMCSPIDKNCLFTAEVEPRSIAETKANRVISKVGGEGEDRGHEGDPLSRWFEERDKPDPMPGLVGVGEAVVIAAEDDNRAGLLGDEEFARVRARWAHTSLVPKDRWLSGSTQMLWENLMDEGVKSYGYAGKPDSN